MTPWKSSTLEIFWIIFGCITIAMMCITVAYSQERLFNGHWTDPVLVYYEDAKGWHMRRAEVEHFNDAHTSICVQHKDHVGNQAKCWFHLDSDNSAVELLPVTLLGEEKT